MNKLLEFWHGSGTNQEGFSFNQIINFDFDELERNHCYIQWLFPLDEPSQAVPESPVIEKTEIDKLVKDDIIVFKMGLALGRMLEFYGLDIPREDKFAIVKSKDFDKRAKKWITPQNHNYLRLTRIMKSLSLLGFGYYAKILQKTLLEIAQEKKYQETIGSKTINFWKQCLPGV